ncbi:TcdA/TcdB pore-forming domain-containing protein, partial [Providencia rustigianii]
AILDAELWGERINDASINLSSEYSLNENWILLFSSVEVIENDRYKIKFINIKDTEITRWVETSDHTFMRFHRYSMEQMGIFGKYYQFEENKIRLRNHEANSISVDGLNAGIAIQSLIQWIEEKNLDKSSVRRNAPNLFLALKIHSYVNYTMMAHGAMNDMIKINQIIK